MSPLYLHILIYISLFGQIACFLTLRVRVGIIIELDRLMDCLKRQFLQAVGSLQWLVVLEFSHWAQLIVVPILLAADYAKAFD